MPYTAEYVKEKLTKELEATHVEVVDLSDGCGAKFNVIVVSPKFAGKPLLQQQRMVNDVLKVEMEDIHALTQRTMTPEQWAAKQQVTASAPGKVILFGEHSVVHGRTAVAAALARRTTICVSAQQEREITTLMPAVSLPLAHFQLPANEQQISGLTLPEESLLNLPVLTKDATPQMLSRLAWWHEQVKDVTPSEARQSLLVLGFLHSALTERFCQGLKIEVSSQLTPGAGTGSSAAYSVALAAALMRFFRDADPGVADVETHAWKAEHLVHGTPSGLDTAVSARGGLVRFRARMVEAEPLPLCLLRVMLVDSGVARDTRRMVQVARDRLDAIGEQASHALLDAMDFTALAALDALQKEQGLERLQHLIRTAQGLLVALGVSHPSLDKICSAAENRGLPAKLTGAGGGGNAFVLLLPSSGDFTALRSELLHELHCSSADEEQLFGPGVIIN